MHRKSKEEAQEVTLQWGQMWSELPKDIIITAEKWAHRRRNGLQIDWEGMTREATWSEKSSTREKETSWGTPGVTMIGEPLTLEGWRGEQSF